MNVNFLNAGQRLVSYLFAILLLVAFVPFASGQVTQNDFDAIRAAYPEFNLSEDMTDYNVIEVAADQLSVETLQDAIDIAAQTVEDDLIVVRMDSFETGTVALRADIVNNGALKIDIDSYIHGSITIIAMDAGGSPVDISDLFDNSEIIVYGNTVFNNEQYCALPKYYSIEVVDNGIPPLMAEAKPLVGLDKYLADPRFTNLKGGGYTTVIIDTGIYPSHSDFAGKLVYYKDFYNNTTAHVSNYTVHGTHVASIAAGWNHGIAQDADIIVLNVFPTNGGSTKFEKVALALKWVANNANTRNIASINMSLGGGNFQTRGNHASPDADAVNTHIHTLKDMGILVTIATGNSFNSTLPGITAPATNASAISVAHVWDADGLSYGGYHSKKDAIVQYAQRAPGLVDILAPGHLISAAGTKDPNSTYGAGGTSMAAPIVAGAAVLAQQVAVKYLGRKLTVEEFRSIISQTGADVVDTWGQGGITPTGATYKRLDIHAMAQAIHAMAATPTNFRSTGKALTTISLAWNPVSNAASYQIQCRLPGGDWGAITPAIAINGTTAVASGLVSGTTYQFRIRARNAAGNSPWSAGVSETTDVLLTVAPANFRSTGKTLTTVSLAWNTVPGATSYQIQCRLPGGDWGSVTPAIAYSGTTAVASGLLSSTVYQFRIRARNAAGNSPWSAGISETTVYDIPPAIPTSFYATGKTLATISLAWNPVSGATSYQIQCRLPGGDWGSVTPAITFNGTTAVASGLLSSTVYQFRIRARNAVGNSPWSAGISETTVYDIPPAIPTSFYATGKTLTTISLAWNPVSGATSYQIQCRLPGGDWGSVTPAITFNGTTAVASGLLPSTVYQFRIRARNAIGNSPWSVDISEATVYDIPPVTPTDLHSTGKTLTTISLAWNPVSGATSYQIQCRLPGGAWGETSPAIAFSGTTAVVSGLTSDTTYQFRVRGRNATGNSPWSSGVSVTTDSFDGQAAPNNMLGASAPATLPIDDPAMQLHVFVTPLSEIGRIILPSHWWFLPDTDTLATGDTDAAKAPVQSANESLAPSHGPATDEAFSDNEDEAGEAGDDAEEMLDEMLDEFDGCECSHLLKVMISREALALSAELLDDLSIEDQATLAEAIAQLLEMARQEELPNDAVKLYWDAEAEMLYLAFSIDVIFADEWFVDLLTAIGGEMFEGCVCADESVVPVPAFDEGLRDGFSDEDAETDMFRSLFRKGLKMFGYEWE